MQDRAWPMHDIRFIREHPDDFDVAMKRRKIDVSASSILEMENNAT